MVHGQWKNGSVRDFMSLVFAAVVQAECGWPKWMGFNAVSDH
jgi:hypothetical protein